jgi:hypothetical protein
MSKPNPVKAAADIAALTETLRLKRATQRRPVAVRAPGPEDSPNSAGVVVEFALGAQTSTTLDMNRGEARDLLDALARFLYGDLPELDYATEYVQEADEEGPLIRQARDLVHARQRADRSLGDRVLMRSGSYRVPAGEWEAVDD